MNRQTLLAQWQRGRAAYDSRPVRERVLILLTACVLLLFAGWELLVTPQLNAQQRLQDQRGQLQAQQLQWQAQQQALTLQLAQDPTEALRQRLARREGRVVELQAELAASPARLVSPRDMVVLLRTLLEEQQGLQLEALELRPPQALSDESARGELYAHEVELVVLGSYLDVLAYLQRIERLEPRLGWSGFDYRVEAYPQGQARVRVRTLSLEPTGLGV